MPSVEALPSEPSRTLSSTEEVAMPGSDPDRASYCGRGVTIIPTNRMLTTQEAADVLGVSRPTLVKVLESGDLRFSKVGRHRRVALGDLLAYRESQSSVRLQVRK